MKAYVQFYVKQGDPPKMAEACGSDGVFTLDARNKLDVMIQDAKDRMSSLKAVQKYEHFEIRRGNLGAYVILHSTMEKINQRRN